MQFTPPVHTTQSKLKLGASNVVDLPLFPYEVV